MAKRLPPELAHLLSPQNSSKKWLIALSVSMAFVFGIFFSSSCLNISAGNSEVPNLKTTLIDPSAVTEITDRAEVELLPVEAKVVQEKEVKNENSEFFETLPGEKTLKPKTIDSEVEALLAKSADSTIIKEATAEEVDPLLIQSTPPTEAMPFVAAVYLQATGYPVPTTLEEIKRMREQLTSLDPEATMTWGMDLLYVMDETNRESIQYVLKLVEEKGDEIGIGYGFPNNLHDTEGFAKVMWEWVYFYRYNAFTDLHVHEQADPRAIWESIPEQFRPKSFVTYAINHEQAKWAQDTFEIENFMGWTATQYFVDQLSGSGSPLMPYWSHKDNPMVPAQSEEDRSGAFFMNTITVDPIGSKYTQDASRWTIHPADPYVSGANPQIHTIQQYLENPFRNRNTLDYLSLFIDINWMYRDANLRSSWDATIDNWPLKETHPVDVMSISDFAKKWDMRTEKSNEKAEFTLLFRGSGDEILVPGEHYTKSYRSEDDTQYLWTETMTERIILEKTDNEKAWKVIDFTDYTGEIPALRYTTEGKYDDVSFVTGRNYKLTKQVSLKENEVERIKTRLSDLEFKAPVILK